LTLAVEAAAQPTCFAQYPVQSCDGSSGEDFFLGRVLSLRESASQSEVEGINGYVHGRAVVSVEALFTGGESGVVELELRQGCWGSIYKGHRYLFHVSQTETGLYASRWSGELDNLTPEEFDDLIRGIRARARGVREPPIYGKLTRYAHAPVPDVVVVAEKDGEKFEERTDAQGRYAFGELPDGDYKVYPLLPTSLRPPDQDGQPREQYDSAAHISGESLCGARVDFIAWDNGVIGGGVEDEEGRGLPYVYVNLRNRSNYGWGNSYAKTLKGADEKFAFVNLSPGSYHIEVAVKDEDGQVLTFYYPGVLVEKDASAIELAAGDQLTDLRIKLPRLKRRRIFGQVKMPDGTPADAIIMLTDQAEQAYKLSSDTKGGWFEFLFFQGRPFHLFAYHDGMKDGRLVRFYKFTKEMSANGDLGPLTLTLDDVVNRSPH
jgi:hypothetical protein